MQIRKISLALILTLLFSITAFATTDNTEGSEELPTYQNVFEGTISAYTHNENGEVISFGYELPFTVHYNDTYQEGDSVINVKDVIIIDGAPVINTVVSTSSSPGIADLYGTMQCQKADGTYVTEEINVICWMVKYGDTEITDIRRSRLWMVFTQESRSHKINRSLAASVIK